VKPKLRLEVFASRDARAGPSTYSDDL